MPPATEVFLDASPAFVPQLDVVQGQGEEVRVETDQDAQQTPTVGIDRQVQTPPNPANVASAANSLQPDSPDVGNPQVEPQLLLGMVIDRLRGEVIAAVRSEVRTIFGNDTQGLGGPRPAAVPNAPLVFRGFEPVRAGFKPELFDGSGPWAEYRAHFETVAKANVWDYRAKGLALASSLRGPAQSVLADVPDQDYRELVGRLDLEFGNCNRSQVYQLQLRARRQGDREDISAFARDVKQLARKAFPMAGYECMESHALSQFTEGLVDDRVREVVMLGSPTTLGAAVEMALKADAAVTRSRSMARQQQGVGRNVRQLGHVPDEAQEEPVPLGQVRVARNQPCLRCDQVGHTAWSCPTRVQLCLRCDRPGHIARECPTRTGNGRTSQ